MSGSHSIGLYYQLQLTNKTTQVLILTNPTFATDETRSYIMRCREQKCLNLLNNQISEIREHFEKRKTHDSITYSLIHGSNEDKQLQFQHS